MQLAVVDGEVFVLEANPRASRTVPFASKATGINLVEAACRLACGDALAELDLPADPTAEAGFREGRGAAVRALPGRRPGARPGDALDRRGDGERGRFPDRLREGGARGRAAAAAGGTAFLSVRDADKPAAVEVAGSLSKLGFRLVATAGTARALAAAGIAVEHVRKVAEGGRGPDRRRPRPPRPLRPRRQHAVRRLGARSDGYLIREAALAARVPCITTIAGAAAAVHAIADAQGDLTVSLQEQISAQKTKRLASSPTRPSGPYALLRLERGGLDPGVPGQFFMLEAPGRVLPRPMSLCQAPPGELPSCSRRSGPERARSQRSSPATRSTSSARSATATGWTSSRPLLVGGGIGVAPFPYLSEQLGSPPAILGFRSDWHAEAAALVPNADGRRRADPRHGAPVET